MGAERLQTAYTPRPAYTLTTGTWELLNHLRFVALRCRCKPRTDLFEACALLHVNRTKTLEARGEALMRCLNQAIGKRALLHAPGSHDVSFDEAWLMQMATAAQEGDTPSLTFLLRSRVAPEHRRLMGYLVGAVTECFSLN